jgi:hypothetical protein
VIDMSYVIAEAMAADAGLSSSTSGRIYADELPKDVGYPCVLVRDIDVVDATPPTQAYDRYDEQIDVIGAPDAYAEAKAIAGDVRRFLFDLRGPVEGGGINATTVEQTTFLVDDSVSPAHPRWVLAVEVTARTTTEGG